MWAACHGCTGLGSSHSRVWGGEDVVVDATIDGLGSIFGCGLPCPSWLATPCAAKVEGMSRAREAVVASCRLKKSCGPFEG